MNEFPVSGMHVSDIQQSFATQFGTPPAYVVRAPGRINVIGEHTDYNNGLVLPAAIDKAIWMAAGTRTDNRLVFYANDLQEFFEGTIQDITFQRQKTWANYLLGAIRELQKDGFQPGGFNLLFGGDVPLGAGLSSSAAIESGLLYLLNQLFELGLSSEYIILAAQRGENNFVGMNCGVMDMFASVMGRKNQVIRLDCRDLSYQYFPFESEEYSLVLFDSRVKHMLVDSAYNTRRQECETGVKLLATRGAGINSLRDVSPDWLYMQQDFLPANIYRRCKFVVDEISRVDQACAALVQHDFEKLGQLMYEGHAGLQDEYEVCVPETNFLVEFSRSHADVAGARQMGGGFGGCTLHLVKAAALEAVSRSTTDAYRQKFGLDLKVYPVRLEAGTSCVLYP